MTTILTAFAACAHTFGSVFENPPACAGQGPVSLANLLGCAMEGCHAMPQALELGALAGLVSLQRGDTPLEDDQISEDEEVKIELDCLARPPDKL